MTLPRNFHIKTFKALLEWFDYEFPDGLYPEKVRVSAEQLDEYKELLKLPNEKYARETDGITTYLFHGTILAV